MNSPHWQQLPIILPGHWPIRTRLPWLLAHSRSLTSHLRWCPPTHGMEKRYRGSDGKMKGKRREGRNETGTNSQIVAVVRQGSTGCTPEPSLPWSKMVNCSFLFWYTLLFLELHYQGSRICEITWQPFWHVLGRATVYSVLITSQMVLWIKPSDASN